MEQIALMSEAVNTDIPIDVPPSPRPRPKPCKRRLKISPQTWASVAAFCSRERTLLEERAPRSPRIRPTLPKLQWLSSEEVA